VLDLKAEISMSNPDLILWQNNLGGISMQSLDVGKANKQKNMLKMHRLSFAVCNFLHILPL